ncbi:MAG TPA: amidase domain-containing protein [Patescibacteria group bacterium]|nr:amidase domain-containing protein [Patescibacteria group bacterium]
MRKAVGTDTSAAALGAVIVIACFAGTLGGCAPDDETPIPQENPKEELWSARSDVVTSSLMTPEDGIAAAAAASSSAYDRQRALDYVRSYAKDPNARFDYCGDWTFEDKRPVKVGADCTNFASQVLQHGGLRMRRGGAGDPGWWSEGGCRPWSSSDSWRQVYPLIHELLSVSRRGEVVQDVRKLKVGDLIFYRLREASKGYACPQEATYNHTTVVSGFDGRGDPLVSYHSNDALDVPWDARNGRQGSLGEACSVLLIHIRD